MFSTGRAYAGHFFKGKFLEDLTFFRVRKYFFYLGQQSHSFQKTPHKTVSKTNSTPKSLGFELRLL